MSLGKYIKAQNDPNVWVRPLDWLPIDPLVSVGDHKFVGLMAIFPDRPNVWVHSSTQAYTVRVDGVATNYAGGSIARGEIAFSAVSNSTITTEGFKQVIIEVYPQVATWTGNFEITHPGTIIPRMDVNQYIDVRMSAPNISNMFMNSGARMLYLRRWTWLGSQTVKSRALAFNSPYLEEVNEDFSTSTSAGIFNQSKLPRVLGDITFTNVTGSAASAFAGAYGNEIMGNLSFPNATNAVNILLNLVDTVQIGNLSFDSATTGPTVTGFKLRTIGNVNIPLVSSFGIGGHVLKAIGTITTGPSLTSLVSAFANSRLLENVAIINCVNVTNTASMFNLCYSLKNVTLNGLKVGFTVPPCNMDETAFINLFNSLGTAAGSQTIVITGNITLSAPTIAIATGKGYTITP